MKLLILIAIFLSINLNADIVKNSANTLKDTKTNYIWQDTKDTSSKKMTFKESIDYCENLELDGYKSWELPGFMEMFSIVDMNFYNPTISKSFKFIVADDYWSSKVVAHASTQESFVINFLTGAFNRTKMDEVNYVRCYQKSE